MVAKTPELAPLAVRGHEAARIISVSERTLRRLTADGTIPSAKVGGNRIYRIEALNQFLIEREREQCGRIDGPADGQEHPDGDAQP